MAATNFFFAAAVPLLLYWLLAPLYIPPQQLHKAWMKKNVIVTGASQGIGKAIVMELVQRDANIVIVSRTKTKLEAVREEALRRFPETKSKIIVLAADLSAEWTCRKFMENALNALDNEPLDALILNHIAKTNVGFWLVNSDQTSDSTAISAISMEKQKQNQEQKEMGSLLNHPFESNFFSYVWLTTFAMDSLKLSAEGGQIGVVSSLAGYAGTPKTAVYSATKHALNGFFDALRTELKMMDPNSNISITIANIGATDTEGAREYAMGEMSDKITWDPADKAAKQIIMGVANRNRAIFHPHHLIFPSVILNQLFPQLMDFILKNIIQ